GGGARGDAAPPSAVLSGSRAKSADDEGVSESGVDVEPVSKRDEAEQHAVVSAPSLRDEGPPRG
ncbi:hypothetical protein, partial [Nocardia carnea]|uniref:hypothetical protein n=1 Tax=Nocardia carnea TaxID=37328 RepID=UPI0024569C1E